MPEVVLTFFWRSSGKFVEAEEDRRANSPPILMVDAWASGHGSFSSGGLEGPAVEFLIRPWWSPAAALPSCGGTARLGVATSDFGVSHLTEEPSRLREIRPFGSRLEPSADALEQPVRIGGASA